MYPSNPLVFPQQVASRIKCYSVLYVVNIVIVPFQTLPDLEKAWKYYLRCQLWAINM